MRYLLPSERTRHEVIARGGRLVDRHGKVLAPGRALTGMFVLDRGGALLANFDDTDERGFHHSSFVAGEPVAAAGCITVRDGRILSLSNESGHYIPAPSSLHRVMRKLSELECLSCRRCVWKSSATKLTTIQPFLARRRKRWGHRRGADDPRAS